MKARMFATEPKEPKPDNRTPEQKEADRKKGQKAIANLMAMTALISANTKRRD